MHGIVFRTAWLFSETGHNFVKTILAAARERAGTGEPLRVVDDQVGSPTFAGHLAAAVDEALQRGISPGLYHLAGSGYCSWCGDRDYLWLAWAENARCRPKLCHVS